VGEWESGRVGEWGEGEQQGIRPMLRIPPIGSPPRPVRRFCKLKHHFSSELESVKGNPEDPGIDCRGAGVACAGEAKQGREAA
jgi:hypothetical protein